MDKETQKWIKGVKTRINKLKILEDELSNFQGFTLSITKLTVIKWICKNSEAMKYFALFIAREEFKANKFKANDEIIELIREGVDLMENSINSQETDRLRIIYNELYKYQNKIRKISWNHVRSIEDWSVYLIEVAISCFLWEENERLGYELAKSWTEKYNPSYGTGLIPASLNNLKEIRFFWENYISNKDLIEIPSV
jgi:hypothetical protein